MAPKDNDASLTKGDQADFAQAFQELAKGERTATALENQLSRMEAKIEQLLAEAEQRQLEAQQVRQAATAKATESRKD